MDLIDKINNLREEQKINQLKISKFIGLSAPHVSDALNRKGRKFQAEHIPKLAKLFKVSESYLLGSEDIVYVKNIPLIGFASCGIPSNYDLNGYESVPVSAKLYKEGMYAVQAEGESMSPKINDRNIVYCNAHQHINNGDIVHYSIDGESGIKKYKMNEKGDTISLVPLNMEYDVISIHADEHVVLKMAKVVGVVDTDF